MNGKLPSRKQVLSYALTAADDNRDTLGNIDLTFLEEDVMIHFEIQEGKWEEYDFSYEIFRFLEKRGMLE